MPVQGPDVQKLRAALESVRDELVAVVHAWRVAGERDDDMAFLVDGRRGGAPSVSSQGRRALERTIPDFDPSLAIELAKDRPGQAPAILDLPGLVRRVVWIDLTPPYTW